MGENEVPTDKEKKNEIVATQGAGALVTPVDAERLKSALKAYQDIQRALDASMKDQTMKIGNKVFRKKGYWRGVKTAFSISFTDVKVERIREGLNISPNHPLFEQEDWGYRVTSMAVAPNGVSMVGVGTCMWSEKVVYQKDYVDGKRVLMRDDNGMPIVDWVATMDNASEHNVCGHAETRSKNRAISDLVGFGEVSAEELSPASRPSAKKDAPPKEKTAPADGGSTYVQIDGCISQKQANRLFAIAKSKKDGHKPWPDEEIKKLVLANGYEHTNEIPYGDVYDNICSELEL